MFLSAPVWLCWLCLEFRVPVFDGATHTTVTIRSAECVGTDETHTYVDTATMGVFHTLKPLDDGETLGGRASTKHRPLFFRGLQSHLGRLCQLKHHVLRRHRLDRGPLHISSQQAAKMYSNITLTQPGMRPRSPRRAPTSKAPFLQDSTVTRPKGPPRDGIKAKSATLRG